MKTLHDFKKGEFYENSQYVENDWLSKEITWFVGQIILVIVNVTKINEFLYPLQWDPGFHHSIYHPRKGIQRSNKHHKQWQWCKNLKKYIKNLTKSKLKILKLLIVNAKSVHVKKMW